MEKIIQEKGGAMQTKMYGAVLYCPLFYNKSDRPFLFIFNDISTEEIIDIILTVH